MMDESDDIETIVVAWIAMHSSETGTVEYERNSWAGDRLLDWAIEGDSKRLWEFVQSAYKRELPDNVLAVLAAGPMEDLLAHHGPEYIGRVEDLARTDPKFNFLLGGVWKNTMTDDVWRRVQAIRNEVW